MKKNIFKFAGVLILIVAIFAISTAFTGKETKSTSSKNSCTVYVKYSNGSAAEGIKVSGDVCGGVSCVGGTGTFTPTKTAKPLLNGAKVAVCVTFMLKGLATRVTTRTVKLIILRCSNYLG